MIQLCAEFHMPASIYWHQRKSQKNIRTTVMFYYDILKYKLKKVSYFPVLLPVLFEDAEFSVAGIPSISEVCTSATLIPCHLIGTHFIGMALGCRTMLQQYTKCT
jgi:hypothetical protein